MKKVRLDIMALSHSVTQSHNYAVVLGEENGKRRLPIVIGGFEAQAIAVALENMTPNRPLTHDLFKNTLDSFAIELKEVVINNLLDGIFYAQLICIQDGNVMQIDARTSDAIAMAVRFACPIYTFEFIMESAGVILDEEEKARKTPVRPKTTSIEDMNVQSLEKLLDEALQKEDYEKAAQIRDIISSKKSMES
ncbi:MAG: bifunctional nuclease domain-containing protein [Saprospiraceae bacterium]|jgi:bifunctional DNase/RNase|nr:bifunctional nuclease family protein [Saprospiraceae bacterium]MBP6447062.1 bifunctional nuclease family protein [Saprospiraceae bacterium]